MFQLDPLALLRGQLPPRAHGLVIAWAAENRSAIKAAWRRRSGPRTARDDISARIKASPFIYIIANIPSLTFDVADFEEAK